MTKEYIEREKAIEWFMAFVHMGESDIPAETVISDLKYAIPAADVVKVVRCKDCLHSTERYGHMECIHGVSYRNTWNKPDFFCSYGERKEGADNG